MAANPWVCPIYLPGKEPGLEALSPEERYQMTQVKYWSDMTSAAMESCPVKTAMSGVLGFGLGGFFSLLSASFAIDDPLRRSNLQAAAMAANPGQAAPPEMTTMQQTRAYFKETGKQMYRSGKGFGKVGALYAGIECCIEGVSTARGCGSHISNIGLHQPVPTVSSKERPH